MFSAKYPPEIITLSFDFAALSVTVSAPVVTVEYDSGVPDANPSAILSGVPVVQGAKVLQQVIAGQKGTHYAFQCKVTAADGQSVYVLEEVLPVL